MATRLETALRCPPPTDDIDRALDDLRDTGIGVVRDALEPAVLGDVHGAVYRAAAADRRAGREAKFGLDKPEDDTNQRVWNLPSRDPVFLDLVEHPLGLQFVETTIGWPVLLSNISANITGPGGGEMVLHADQLYMPEPWSGVQGINIAWCADDFTADNGATQAVPGSHRYNRAPSDEDQGHPTVPVEAPAGSMIAMDGRVWHRTGNNVTSDQRRAGIFGWYTAPIYLPQENWWLSLDASIRQFGSDTLQVLFGYQAAGLGQVYGASPVPATDTLAARPTSATSRKASQ